MNINISNKSVKELINFIVDDNIETGNIEKFQNYNFFCTFFDTCYSHKKKIYYQQVPVFSKRMNENLPEWMIKRILNIDKYDSMDKFGNKKLIKFFKKREINKILHYYKNNVI